MSLGALRSFTTAFVSAKSLKNAASIPIYHVQAVARKHSRALDCRESHRSQVSRRHASVATPVDTANNDTRGHSSHRYASPIEPEATAFWPRYWSDPSAWATLLESYLPGQLRLKDERDLDPTNTSPNMSPMDTFNLVLSRARKYAKVDLLSDLGVHHNRWEAVVWLVKAMLEDYPRHAVPDNTSNQLPSLLWATVGPSLDTITEHAISTIPPQPWNSLLDQLTSRSDNDQLKHHASIGRKNLGQIWQTLGNMVIQAADRSPEDPSYSVIMSHVFRILALLHRIDAFPSSIYNYTPAADPTVLRRPPTLYLLSKRIMSVLSDLEWGLEWEQEIVKYSKLGYNLPKASVQPRIREFGPELWLDLVLWACVEGGWVTEGAWIVEEMEQRKNKAETRWSVISWQEVCAVKAPEPNWTAMLRLQIDKVRLNQTGSIGIATGVDLTVDMGTRTISREVILALTDGLVNTASAHESSHGLVASVLPQGLTACQDLLERGHTELDANFLNTIAARIIESANEDTPGTLRRLLDWRLRHLNPDDIRAGATLSAQDHDTDDTAPILGLLHKALHGFAREGNAQESLATLIRIQTFIDEKRGRHINHFANKLSERLKTGEDITNLSSNEEESIFTIHPHIPVHVMAAFLDLIVQNRFFDLGQWLLQNDDIDGGMIDPELYSNPSLQPALLRFATATANDQLLTRVLQQLETPLSEPILHALLRCQVVLGKWGAVEELLKHFQKSPDISWKASDAMAIARAIMQMEHSKIASQDTKQIFEAQRLLQNLVHGAYNSDRDPSQLPDLSESRMANQLGRIFKTLPGSLSTINIRSTGTSSRAHAGVKITPNAFNILLEVIVQCYGSVAGTKFWEQWCLDPGDSKLAKYRRYNHRSDIYGEIEKVVTPAMYMLRTVLRPILEKTRIASPHDSHEAAAQPDPETLGLQEADITDLIEQMGDDIEMKTYQFDEEDCRVLDWGMGMYRKFGLSNKEIKAEIPGCFRNIERREGFREIKSVVNES